MSSKVKFESEITTMSKDLISLKSKLESQVGDQNKIIYENVTEEDDTSFIYKTEAQQSQKTSIMSALTSRVSSQNSSRRLKKQRQMDIQQANSIRLSNKSPPKPKQSVLSLHTEIIENISRDQPSKTHRVMYTERSKKSKKMAFEEDKLGSQQKISEENTTQTGSQNLQSGKKKPATPPYIEEQVQNKHNFQTPEGYKDQEQIIYSIYKDLNVVTDKQTGRKSVDGARDFLKTNEFTDQSLSTFLKDNKDTQKSIKETIKKASASFQLDKKFRETGDLVIENKRLVTTITILNQKLSNYKDSEEELKRLRTKNKNLNLDNLKLKEEVNQFKTGNILLSERIKSQEDTIKDLDENVNDLENEIDVMTKSKDGCKQNNSELNIKVIDLEQEVFEAKTIQLDLLEKLKLSRDQIDEYDNKIQVLIKENKSFESINFVYLTNQSCPIDKVLGQWINSHPERFSMRVLFRRKSEGVYDFGTKTVNIKVEKGERILIRVGGGYINIQEFLNQHSQPEIDKICMVQSGQKSQSRNKPRISMNYTDAWSIGSQEQVMSPNSPMRTIRTSLVDIKHKSPETLRSSQNLKQRLNSPPLVRKQFIEKQRSVQIQNENRIEKLSLNK